MPPCCRQHKPKLPTNLCLIQSIACFPYIINRCLLSTINRCLLSTMNRYLLSSINRCLFYSINRCPFASIIYEYLVSITQKCLVSINKRLVSSIQSCNIIHNFLSPTIIFLTFFSFLCKNLDLQTRT